MLRGLIRGMQKTNLKVYRIVKLDKGKVPLYQMARGIKATGPSAQSVLAFLPQLLQKTDINASFRIFMYEGFYSVRINGKGANFKQVLDIWKGGVSNERGVLQKAIDSTKDTEKTVKAVVKNATGKDVEYCVSIHIPIEKFLIQQGITGPFINLFHDGANTAAREW